MLFTVLLTSLLLAASGQRVVRFVALGDDSGSTNLNLLYSYDGLRWLTALTPFTIQTNSASYSLELKRWIVGGAGAHSLAWSDDGINWVGLGTTIFSNEAKGSHFATGLWVATGRGAVNTLARSTDGKTWIGLGNSIFTTRANDVVYSTALSRWVAVGEGTNSIATSNDGNSWTGLGLDIYTPIGTKPLSINYSPTLDQLIITGLHNIHTQQYSSDGISWTGTNSLFGNQVWDAEYGQSKWVVTGPPNPNPTPFAISTNGINWVIQPNVSLINGGRGLAYNEDLDLWVANGFGQTTSLLYSEDGVNWKNGQARFSITGYDVATGGYTPEPSPLPEQVVDLVVNASIVEVGNQSTVNGQLEVTGDLVIGGCLTMTNSSTINVTDSIKSNGTLVVDVNATIQCNQLRIVAGSQLVINVPTNINSNKLTVVVANYSRVTGVYQVELNSNQCDQVSDVNYGSNGLAVTIDVRACAGSDSSSTAMIIGLAVGISCLGVAIAITIAIVISKARDRRDAQARAQLKEDNVVDLRRNAALM